MFIETRRWHIGLVRRVMDVEEPKYGYGGDVHIQECYACGLQRTANLSDQCLGKQCREKAKDHNDKRLPPMNTALLLVCRQFYEDAAELKWQNHIFQVNLGPHTRYALMAFVEKLTQWQRKALRTLHAHLTEWHSDKDYPGSKEVALSRIEDLIGLRSLIVNLRSEVRHMPKIDLRGRTGVQLESLRLIDLDAVSVRLLVTTIPPPIYYTTIPPPGQANAFNSYRLLGVMAEKCCIDTEGHLRDCAA
jgi:hypothetical protein